MAMQIAAGAAFCIVFGSAFWRAATEPAAQIGYPSCGAMTDDAQRLACFDNVVRQNSITDARRMTFAEILSGLRRNGDSPAAPR